MFYQVQLVQGWHINKLYSGKNIAFIKNKQAICSTWCCIDIRYKSGAQRDFYKVLKFKYRL